MALEKHHFLEEHRPRFQQRKDDVLGKRTNDYQWRKKKHEKLPPVADN